MYSKCLHSFIVRSLCRAVCLCSFLSFLKSDDGSANPYEDNDECRPSISIGIDSTSSPTFTFADENTLAGRKDLLLFQVQLPLCW